MFVNFRRALAAVDETRRKRMERQNTGHEVSRRVRPEQADRFVSHRPYSTNSTVSKFLGKIIPTPVMTAFNTLKTIIL